MGNVRKVRIGPFLGAEDDGNLAEQGRATYGQNWLVTRRGFLAPGLQKALFTPGACESVVLDDPSNVDPGTLRDLADQTGEVYLNRINLWMGSPHENFDLDQTYPTEALAEWPGRYFDVADLDTEDVRVRTLKQVLEDTGVERVWFLDDRSIREGDDDIIWTAASDSSCGPIQSEFDNLHLKLRWPQLVMYDNNCWELTAWMVWEFTLAQGDAGDAAEDLEQVMEYEIWMPLFVTTGEVRATGRSLAVSAEGVEQDTSSTPDKPAAMVGLPRWPLSDQAHLSDPNLINLGICTNMDAGGACQRAYKWEHKVYTGPRFANAEGWAFLKGIPDSDKQNPSTPSGRDGNFYWRYDVNGPFDEQIEREKYTILLGAQESRRGVTLCEFIEWIKGPYQHWIADDPSGIGIEWDNTMIVTGHGVSYQEEAEPPLHLQDENFLHVWTGKVCVPMSGRYRFYVAANNGFYLGLDGESLAQFAGADSRANRYMTTNPAEPNEYVYDPRVVFERWIESGLHEIEVRWHNSSPWYLWHIDLCPKPWAAVPEDRPAWWRGTEGEWDTEFPIKCSETLPVDPAPCCRGLDPLVGCELLITELHISSEEPTTDFQEPEYSTSDQDLELTDCYGPLVEVRDSLDVG